MSRLAAVLVIGATLVVAGVVLIFLRVLQSGPAPAEDRAVPGDRHPEQQIVFVDTSDENFRKVASVPSDNPDGPRILSDQVCDRLFARANRRSCLTSGYGIPGTYEAVMMDPANTTEVSWKLAGVPSRTTLSPSGDLVATTVFVTGHDYEADAYSTRTDIRSSDGGEPRTGSLESFRIIKDGVGYTSPDVNVWGVTFRDERTFYATVSTRGTSYLAAGSLRRRTLTLLAADVECPSLSPDRQSIAYKRPTGRPGEWHLSVYDLRTGRIHALAEKRSVDDQVQWLDSNTVIYGMFRPTELPTADVWQVPSDGGGAPAILIHSAASPSVIR